jgi:group I intron endonuclease
LLGYKHKQESKLKMSISKKGFKHTELTKAKISKNMVHTEESKKKLRSYRHTEEALAKIKASSLGRKLSEESKAKIRANHPKSLNVKVLNIETDITMEFPSIYQTAKYFETNHTTIRNYIKSKKPYRNIYMISV